MGSHPGKGQWLTSFSAKYELFKVKPNSSVYTYTHAHTWLVVLALQRPPALVAPASCFVYLWVNLFVLWSK